MGFYLVSWYVVRDQEGKGELQVEVKGLAKANLHGNISFSILL